MFYYRRVCWTSIFYILIFTDTRVGRSAENMKLDWCCYCIVGVLQYGSYIACCDPVHGWCSIGRLPSVLHVIPCSYPLHGISCSYPVHLSSSDIPCSDPVQLSRADIPFTDPVQLFPADISYPVHWFCATARNQCTWNYHVHWSRALISCSYPVQFARAVIPCTDCTAAAKSNQGDETAQFF